MIEFFMFFSGFLFVCALYYRTSLKHKFQFLKDTISAGSLYSRLPDIRQINTIQTSSITVSPGAVDYLIYECPARCIIIIIALTLMILSI